MKRRCYNPRGRDYPYYGGRGIIVCDSWKYSFENFIEDMGEHPFEDAQIERIDNDGNYEPSNCRWATRKEQARNSSQVNMINVGWHDCVIALPHLAEECGFKPQDLRNYFINGGIEGYKHYKQPYYKYRFQHTIMWRVHEVMKDINARLAS